MENILEFFKLIFSNDPFFDLALFLLLAVFCSLAIIFLSLKIFLKFLDNNDFIQKYSIDKLKGINNIDTVTKKEESPSELIKLYIKLNTLLKTDLKSVCTKIDAERIAIYLFHNGTYGLNGFPFIKMSCICEIIKPHSNTFLKQHQQINIPINAVDDFLCDLFHHSIFISNKNKNNLSIVDRLLLNKQNSSNSFIAIAILDKSEIEEPPIGFLMAEFKEISEETKEIRINNLIKLAEESSYALQVSSFLKKHNTVRKENSEIYV